MKTHREICEEMPASKQILEALENGGYGAEHLVWALRVACKPGGIYWNEQQGYLNPAVALELGKIISADLVQFRAVIQLLGKDVNEMLKEMVHGW